MRTFVPFLFLTLFTLATSTAQTARVQFIQNSPGPSSVDVYRGNILFFNNFTFRTASPYMDIPAGDTVNIGIAPKTSTSSSDVVASFPVVFDSGKTYIVMIAGVIGATGPTSLNLYIKDNAQETGPANEVDVTVFHGAPDFPAVDVDAVLVANNLVSNLSFGRYTDYIKLPPALYDLAVQSAGTNNTGITLRADLSGMAGGAVTVFASGYFLSSPSLGVFMAFPDGNVVKLQITPIARVQIIHNSPATTIDLYIDSTRVTDNFTFRKATAFFDLPADRTLRFGVAGINSSGTSDITAVFPINFQSGKRYTVVAAGISGTTNGPAAFNFFLKPDAREAASGSGTDINVFHGVPDAGALDVDAVFETDNLVSSLSFGQFTNYINFFAAKSDLALSAAGSTSTIASFRADLSSLSGRAATVFASGFLSQSPVLGLFAALPDGTVLALPATPNARIQIIHDAPAPVVDIYVGNTRLIDNFEFRKATPFINIPADRNIVVKVAAESSNSSADAFASFPLNLATGGTYLAIAAGLPGTTGPTAFNLFVKSGARENGSGGNVAITVFQGITDAGVVDVDALFETDNLVSNLPFGGFSDYLSLSPAKYDLALQPAGSNFHTASFLANLEGLPDFAATVFASGFISQNPSAGLYAALPDGTVLELPATSNARMQIIHNSPEQVVDIYVNNVRLIDNFEFSKATPFINMPSDRNFTVKIAAGSSTSPADAFASFPLNLTTGGTYLAVAAGIIGATGSSALNLFVKPDARENSTGSDIALTVLQGATDIGVIDMDVLFETDNFVSNLSYGTFSDYLNISPAIYDFVLQQAGTGINTASFRADLSGLAGRAATVFTSGLSSQIPQPGMFAALSDGTVLQFPAMPFARIQIVHSSPVPFVDVYVGNTRLLDNFEFRKATPFMDMPSDRNLLVKIAADTSTSAANPLASFQLDLTTGETYVAVAAGTIGTTGSTALDIFLKPGARESSAVPGSVDVQFFHGSTDAPEIDIRLPGGAVIFDNIQYGEFSGYQSAIAADYKYYLTPSNNNNSILGAYIAECSQHPGEAVTVFASGYYSGVSPAFALWAAFGSGATMPLAQVAVSATQPDLHEGISVWPSPTADMLALKMNVKENAEIHYRIIDMEGRMVQEGSFGQVNAGILSETISLGKLEQGAYCIQVLSGSGMFAQKLMIQR